MNKDQLDQYIGQLELDKADEECEPEWKLFGTLTVRGSPSRSKARRLLDRWVAEIRKVEASSRLDWFAVIEYGRFAKETRIHILIGGSRINFQRWRLRWKELSRGDAVIYDYHVGAFPKYLLRQVYADRYFDIAMELCGWGLFELSERCSR